MRDASKDFTHGKDVQVLVGDCIESMRSLPSLSVHTCITSPPYYGLRDYGDQQGKWWGGKSNCEHEHGERQTFVRRSNDGGKDGTKQGTNRGANERDKPIEHTNCTKCDAWYGSLGLEPTPEQFVKNLVEVFREVKRVLRDDGTLWLNLGDSYAGGGGSSGHTEETKNMGRKTNSYGSVATRGRTPSGFKAKDLMMMPHRVAIALQEDGWYVRQDIVWDKPNPMPESVKDRCTKNHEYIFLLSKNRKYYYDAEAIREPLSEPTKQRDKTPRGRSQDGGGSEKSMAGYAYTSELGDMKSSVGGRNKRSVWTITTKPYKGAHFATFPAELIEPCVLAGTSAKGCCADCGQPYSQIIGRPCQKCNSLIPTQGKSCSHCGYKNTSWLGERENNRAKRAGEDNTIGALVARKKDLSPNKIMKSEWVKSCSCESDIIPCIVLDPFAGSGTTAGVAVKHERKAIMCELNPEYAAIIPARIEDISGLSNTQQTLLDW